MQNRRLLFSVIIKLLTYGGLIFLTLVFVNSLFSSDDRTISASKENLPVVSLDLAEMYKGQIRKVRWNNKEVAILLRQFPEKLDQFSTEDLQQKTHPSIKSQTRSINPQYFVYFNIGDSRNCPLHYAAGVFKDVCSSNRFDETGRNIKANSQSYMLEIPPHYYEENTIIIGQWKS